MRNIVKYALFVSTAVLALQSNAASYNLTFKGGELPGDVITESRTGFAPDASGYKRGWTKSGWTCDRYGTRGYVALCPTYSPESIADVESVLTLPPLGIEASNLLSWEALSMMPQRPEQYKVVATDADSGEETLLAEINGEDGVFTPHAISLSGFAGKKIALSFICTSTHGYMLALSDVKVSAPTSPILKISGALPQKYAGVGIGRDIKNIPLQITFTNVGCGGNTSLQCSSMTYDSQYSDHLTQMWECGEQKSVTFNITALRDMLTNYSISIEGSDTPLYESELYASAFRRTMLVEEGTGLWCVNCTAGMLASQQFEREYGEESAFFANAHYSDILDNPQYCSGLEFHSLPTLMLNRVRNTASDNTALFTPELYLPSDYRLSIESSEVSEERVNVKVAVESAENVNNEDGNLRIGYILTGDFHEPENGAFKQRNSSTSLTSMQYYYLPSEIPASLSYCKDVALTGHEYAFEGVKGSVAAELSPGVENYFTFSLTPADFTLNYIQNLNIDLKDTRVMALLIHAGSGQILAVDSAPANMGLRPGSVPGIEEDRVLETNNLFYNLHGMCVGSDYKSLPSGIYIHKGKKLIKNLFNNLTQLE